MTATLPVPAAITDVAARLEDLRARMTSATVAPPGFAAALTSAGATPATGASPAAAPPFSAPAPPTGTAPSATPLPLASQPVQGIAQVLRPAALSAPSRDVGAAAVTEARKYLGTMYQWGGEDPSTGFDCSGLVQWAYKQQGIPVPRTTYEQVHAGRAVPVDAASLRPGDLLFTSYSSRGPEHVVMWAGNGKVIEAPRTGLPVRVRAVDLADFSAARRVAPTASAAPAASSGWAAKLPAAARPYVAQIGSAASRAGVDPALVAAVIWHESGFNAAALSPAGAVGLGQLMPGTAAELGVNPRDPAQNIAGTATYLARQLKAFGSVQLAAAAYNAGPGAVRSHGGVPPYGETRAYVADVSAKYHQLRGAS